MVNYRRNYVQGGIYFFTVTLKDRSATTLTTHIDLLTDALRKTRSAYPFTTLAMVVMPDHIHTVWQLPSDDYDYSSRWRMIKARFTKSICGGKSVWQPRFWERTVRDNAELNALIDYTHYNPVKHGLATTVKDWPYSTFHSFVARGELPLDWGGGAEASARSTGE